jgi:hypothetical protein
MTTVGQPPRIPTQRAAPARRKPSPRMAPIRGAGRIASISRVGSTEFPPPRFPSGVGVPPLALLGTLLLAAVGMSTIRIQEPVVVLGGPQGWPGAVPAVAMALVALWAWLTLRITVVGPVRRLRNSVLERSCGRRVRRSLVRDVDRILASVREICRPTSGRARRRDLWPRLPMVAVLVLVGVVVLGSLGFSYLALSRSSAVDSQVLAVEIGQDTARAADRLQSALLSGLSTSQGVAGPAAGGSADLEESVSRVLASRPVFRAVYVLDPSGRQVAAAGSPPGRAAEVLPAAGIGQLNTSGSAPLIVAVAPLYDGNTLVGEYDPRALNDVLGASGARLRVVDPGMRTVLSNHGYQAFSELRDRELRAAAATPAAAGSSPVAVVRTVADAAVTVAAQRIGADGDPLAALGWVLLADEDVNAAKFAHDPAGRDAAVVSGLGAGITLALLGWVYVATVRPLREAAAHAAAIAAARNGAAPPVPRAARRVDEIGAIVNGLNRHLHSIGAASPTSPRRVPPSTTLVPTPWPSSPVPRHTPAAGHRGLVEGGSASWPVDDQAFHRSRGAREAGTVVVAGS